MISTEKQPKYQLYHQVKYEYLTGEDILPSNQQQIIEQARFTYSPLGKAFEKQIKTIEDKGQKQIDSLECLKPKEQTKSIEEIFPEGYDKKCFKNSAQTSVNITTYMFKHYCLQMCLKTLEISVLNI